MPPYRRNERACDDPDAQCRAVDFTTAVGKVAEVTGTSQNRRDTAAARPVRNGSTRIDWDR